jgi:hypothetical protein
VLSANLLWSVHDPNKEDALAEVGERLASVRARLGSPPPSLVADPMRFEVLDLASAWNSPPKGEGFDLSGLKPGRHYVEALPYAIADPSTWGGRSIVTVARREADGSTRVALPVRGRWASLVFVQSATGAGRPPIHAGDQTHFPRESAELLGFYEIRYVDGLVDSHAIRYDETVGRWNAGLALPFYFARPLVAGTLPDGRAAVVWASEWTNPRPDVDVASVALVGAPGPTNARPILLGVTAVGKPRVEDLR